MFTAFNHKLFIMKKTRLIFSLAFATLLAVGCSKDKENDGGENPPVSTYTIVNNGNAGVTSITDTEDAMALKVVQAVPAVENVDYPRTVPVLLFFDDKILLSSFEDGGIQVTQGGNEIGGKVYINEGANGYAIMTFVPTETFTANKNIVVSLTGVQDDGGNEIEGGVYSLTFDTNNLNMGAFDGNGDFSSTDGVLFLGDGNIMNDQSCFSSGSSYAAITSGDMLVSSGEAIGGASSMMILGEIGSDISSLTFDYNFLSAEFDEYVGSQFDDSVIMTVVGPNNAYSEFITSVNTVGTAGNTECITFQNMPDTGDSFSGATGWITKTINFSNVGSPAYVIFTVTDVADQIYSSVLAVDNISY